ncbi:LUD domain-containing protein [uncultured Megasphaera sp.]|uniref:LutC/YkgG family protein n=1 Tax=uncultured Megasphaera sp. TaxID=165188 RepID=UPI0012E1F591|nr:LUD domain-containing protein [uncultured Megasphaera sp.]MUP50595.1 lactate utilization protein C [Veillonellaceae bacterium M1-70]
MEKDAVYEVFQKGLTNVNGECYLAKAAEVGATLAKIFQAKETTSVSVVESELFREVGVVKALQQAGITVHTDHFRKFSPDDKGGVTEADYGIANLGSIVQLKDDIDCRIVEIASDVYVGVIKLSRILDDFDAMIDVMAATKPFPRFAGVITGPSRTADIECVGTVGVHGPRQYSVIVVEDR